MIKYTMEQQALAEAILQEYKRLEIELGAPESAAIETLERLRTGLIIPFRTPTMREE